MLAYRHHQCVVGFRVIVRKKTTTVHYIYAVFVVGSRGSSQVKSSQAKSSLVKPGQPAEQIPQRARQDMVGEATFRLPVMMWPCRDT
jgi:hypothetical protein